LAAILFIAVISFVLAYGLYGRFLVKRYALDDGKPTPGHTDYDGIDRVPAHKAVLLGHHFSSIAGAAPIVGPIIGALAFGWAPVLIWVVLGTILVGGVIDFSALVASVRHNARSIAEIAREYMSPVTYKLLLAFIWLTLVYVLTVFADLTATTFVQDGGVATSSILFIALAIMFGVGLNRLKVPLLWCSIVFVPLVFVAVWGGQQIPLKADMLAQVFSTEPKKVWALILIAYCFVASTTPVWILLQPRDYLSSYLLYASVLSGFVGIFLGGFTIHYPAFTSWSVPATGTLFPILFITVACGACSGFHSIVASGTSSKQLNKESDARAIGYGGMLLEGIVAVIALATVVMLPKGDELAGKPPLIIYAAGISKFLSLVGIPERLGSSFGLLALSAFILTTLDTATRLGRYIFEEFFHPGHRDQIGAIYLRGVFQPQRSTLTLPCDGGHTGAAGHIRANQSQGPAGQADTGVEGDLAGVRNQQPAPGGAGGPCHTSMVEKNGQKGGIHYRPDALHECSHAVGFGADADKAQAQRRRDYCSGVAAIGLAAYV
jgi:carbon starvation protein